MLFNLRNHHLHHHLGEQEIYSEDMHAKVSASHYVKCAPNFFPVTPQFREWTLNGYKQWWQFALFGFGPTRLGAEAGRDFETRVCASGLEEEPVWTALGDGPHEGNLDCYLGREFFRVFGWLILSGKLLGEMEGLKLTDSLVDNFGGPIVELAKAMSSPVVSRTKFF